MQNLLVSELRKALSTKSWWGLLIPAAVLSLLLNVVGGAVAQGGDLPSGAVVLTLVTSLSLAGTFALVYGIVALTGEFRHRTITTTYLTASGRDRPLAAKAVLAGVVGALYGAVVALVGVPAALLGHGLADFPDAGRLLAICTLGVLVSAVWAMFGVAIAAMVSNQLAAVIGALVYFLLVEAALAGILTAARAPDLARYLPGQAAGTALTAVAEDLGGPLGASGVPPWWLALLVFLTYVAVVGWVGRYVSRRRDVT